MKNEKKLSSYEILERFFDENSFVETDALLDTSSAVAGWGTVDGVTVFAFSQNVSEMGGAVSKNQAKKISKLYRAALKTGAPVVGFYDSIGAKLDEKYEMLSSYGDILKKASTLSGVVPQISVVLGSCLGTSALMASSADFVIMEKDAALSVDTSGENASSEYNQKAGTASFVCETEEECIDRAKELLSFLPSNNLEPAPAFEPLGAYSSPEKLPQYIADEDSLLCVSSGFGENVCTAFGRVEGEPVAIVRTKGGVITDDDCEKMYRFIRFADAFSIPVITIVNAKRFESTKSASKAVCAYAEATTAKISVIEGEASGAVYIALSSVSTGADAVYALPSAIVSPVAPKAAAYLLEPSISDASVSDQEELSDKFIKENLSSEKAAQDGYIDDIVEKDALRAKIASTLSMLSSKRVSALPKKHTTIL